MIEQLLRNRGSTTRNGHFIHSSKHNEIQPFALYVSLIALAGASSKYFIRALITEERN